MLVIRNSRLRNFLKILIPFVLIPILVFTGVIVFAEKRYLLVSFGVAILAIILFIAGFEKKMTGSRRMVIVSVMTAFCIVGRFIPFFKPITAITVITAIYLGGESGFLVGALAAVLSNFYFGQGPWTPFQMLAWGLIGLFAGYLSKWLKKSRGLLIAYGIMSGVVYSMVMDVWSVVWYNSSFEWGIYKASMITAIPHTVLYAVSNFIFLWFLAKPIGEKLERIRIKYGV
ncbi:MAG: ECF transporter S component [Lachnospiraceae bacterium]|nr:ECF transporter S component [Lachnospiraceae bacterium]